MNLSIDGKSTAYHLLYYCKEIEWEYRMNLSCNQQNYKVGPRLGVFKLDKLLNTPAISLWFMIL